MGPMARRPLSLEAMLAGGFDLTQRSVDETCRCGHRWGDHLASLLDPPPDACGFIDCAEEGCRCEGTWSFPGVAIPHRCAYGRNIIEEHSPGPCEKRGAVPWGVGMEGGDVAHLWLCDTHHELVAGVVGHHAFPPGSLN